MLGLVGEWADERGAHDISTCKSVVKRTQEDDEVLCLLSVLTPIHTLTTVNAATCSLLHLSYSIHSLALDALTFVGILSFLNGARAVGCSVGRSRWFVWHWLVVFPRKKNSTALRMTSSAVPSLPGRSDGEGRPSVDSMTALLDNGSFA